MSEYLPPLREAVNVRDELERDRIVKRFKRAKAKVVTLKNDIENWNRAHPDEVIDTAVEDALIAFLEREAPMPTAFIVKGKRHAFVDGKLREIPESKGDVA